MTSLVLIVVSFVLSGCETLITYPESRSEQQRLDDFPTTNWPVKGDVGYSTREVIFGAQVRHVSNLGDIDENYFVMLGGNDGWLTNPHLYDQTDLWRKGEYMRLPLSSSGVKETFNLKTHRIMAHSHR